MKILCVFIGLFGLITLATAQRRFFRQQQQADQRCYTPENRIGLCVTLTNCPAVVNFYAQSGGSRAGIQYLRAVQRSCNTRSFNGDPIVCCGDPVTNNVVTQRPQTPFFPQPQPQPNPQPITDAPRPVTTTPRRRETTQPPTTRPPTTRPPTTRPPAVDDRARGSCRGPDFVEGTCKEIKQCEPLLTRLANNPKDTQFAKFLRLSNEICGHLGGSHLVCCPPTSPVTVNPTRSSTTTSRPTGPNDIVTRLPTLEEGCGYTNNSFKKIVGGEAAKPGAWPWIALIGYTDTINGGSDFKCGGSLITVRHVLTAAHCIRSDLSFVRLGEHDLSTDREAAHVNINVVKMARYPKYNKRDGHNDIAMLWLARNAPISNTIRPACLPTAPELRSKSYVDYSPFVAGWGRTMEGGASAKILQELQIPIFENGVCRDRYQAMGRLISDEQFDDAVICAGVLAGGKDTCQGDSGGPLMIPETYKGSPRFYIIGVVSYGIGCARPDVPGVYTNVRQFMDWIQEQIAIVP